MRDLVLNLYELLTVLALFILLYLFLWRRRALPCIAVLPGLLLAVYICGVLHFTGAGMLYDALRFRLKINPVDINLLPFSQQIDWQGYFLNLLLLLPFGLLAPMLWPACARPKHLALQGFCFSLFIELSQLLNIRRPDVDDLLLNTAGVLLGWLLFRLLSARRKEQTAALPCSPLLLAAVLFLGRFLLFDEIRAAKLLYGF